MADWNIGINAEGNDIRKEDLKRRGSAAADWARRKVIAKYAYIITVLAKKSKTAIRKELDNDIAYAGVAAEVLNLVENIFPKAMTDVRKQVKVSADKEKAMKIHALALAIKGIAEGADELKKM